MVVQNAPSTTMKNEEPKKRPQRQISLFYLSMKRTGFGYQKYPLIFPSNKLCYNNETQEIQMTISST